MKFFTDDGCKYEGMSEDTVVQLRTELGKSTAFITEEAYNILVAR